jgi:spermidine/putrescine transport system substrate-binding protein
MSQPQRPRLTPEEATIVRLMSGGRLSRRSMLTGAGALGLGAFLSGCGTSAPGSTSTAAAKPTAAVDRSSAEKVVSWDNWADYMDKSEAGAYVTLDEFQSSTGIKVNYSDKVNDNAEYYAKTQAQLRQGKDIQRDIITLTDWMAARVIREGLVQRFNKNVMPNAKNILPNLAEVGWDKGRSYTLTWQSGYTGIAYNAPALKKLGISPPTKIDDLWNPKLKNRVVVLSEMRDTVGMLMLSLGKKPESFTATDFADGLAKLEEQLNSGQIRQVVGGSYTEQLKSEEALAAIGWSGDVAVLNSEYQADNKGSKVSPFVFAKPEDGGMLWSDNVMIPIGSPHKQNAELLINYYYDPKVAAKVAAYVNFLCPVQGAQEEMAKLPDVDKELVESPMIFPGADYLKDFHLIRSLTQAEETEFTANFQKVLGL